MRIHGEESICRSTDVEQENEYKKYVPQLRQDFKNICGYCGKHEEVTSKGFEPDHFVPYRIDPSRELDYSNLVYACFTCNRKKLGKWPTGDKDKPNDGEIGFVDPVLDEYNTHLTRDISGKIKYNTSIGKYMCEEVFKFHLRPIQEIWKAMQLIDAKNKLYKIKDKLTTEEMMEYIELDKNLSELQRILFNKKE